MQKKGIPFYRAKENLTKGLCGFLAFVTIFGGVTIAKLFKKKPVDDTLTTSSSEQIEAEGLLLAEDFDINNKEAVRARAKAIYDLSEKQVSVDDIVNMLYIINEKYDLITLPSGTDAEKIKYLQNLFINISALLDDNLQKYADNLSKLIADKKVEASEKRLIYIYMFMSGQNKEQKNEALGFASLVEKQVNAINKGSKQEAKIIADEFYKKYKDAANWTALDKKTKVVLIATLLDDLAKQGLINNNTVFLNSIFTEILLKFGLNTNELVNEGIKNGFDPTTQVYDKDYYDKNDAKEAEKYGGTVEKTDGEKTTIKGGGKVPNAPGSSEEKNEPTTSKTEEGGVVSIPEGEYTEIIDGGEIVDEKVEEGTLPDPVRYSDADNKILYSDKDVEIKVNRGKVRVLNKNTGVNY